MLKPPSLAAGGVLSKTFFVPEMPAAARLPVPNHSAASASIICFQFTADDFSLIDDDKVRAVRMFANATISKGASRGRSSRSPLNIRGAAASAGSSPLLMIPRGRVHRPRNGSPTRRHQQDTSIPVQRAQPRHTLGSKNGSHLQFGQTARTPQNYPRGSQERHKRGQYCNQNSFMRAIMTQSKKKS